MKRTLATLGLVGMVALSTLAGLAGAFPSGYVVHGGTTATKVKVILAPGGDENKLKPVPTVTKAGEVTFVVSNQANLGPTHYGEQHELVVLKTDLAPGKLRVDNLRDQVIETGRVGLPLPVNPGKTRTITLNLNPGNYVLICNLPGHYRSGQHAAFRVSG